MFEFTAVHSNTWATLLPKLAAAGAKGFHVVGFLNEGGCYSVLMERGSDVPEVTVSIPDAVNPHMRPGWTLQREEDDLDNEEGA